MRKSKRALGVVLATLSVIAAAATTWYIPIVINGSQAVDQDAEFTQAASQFTAWQTATTVSKVAQGDTVVLQYQDGAVEAFVVGPPVECAGTHCTFGNHPWDPNHIPKSYQRPVPKSGGGDGPQVIGLNPGAYLPASFSVIGPNTIFWLLSPSVTITQQGGGAAISVLDSVPGGFGGDGDGGSGGSGGSSGGGGCTSDCPPVDME